MIYFCDRIVFGRFSGLRILGLSSFRFVSRPHLFVFIPFSFSFPFTVGYGHQVGMG